MKVQRNRKISAIIACYKDEKAIPFMYNRLIKTFKKIKADYEIISGGWEERFEKAITAVEKRWPSGLSG